MARKPPLIDVQHPISAAQFAEITKAVADAGYADAIHWSENLTPPETAEEFAASAIYVICNSGLSNKVALPIFEKCMAALNNGKSAKKVFGHPGKAKAINWIWKRRKRLFRKLKMADDLVEFSATLPWIGPITKFH